MVRFKGNEIRCRPNGRSFQEGGEAIVCIRPGKVAILEKDAAVPDGFSIIRGVVRDCLFHGESYRVEVDIDQSDPFLVDVQLPTDADQAVMPVPGSNISITVNPDVVTAYLAEEAF